MITPMYAALLGLLLVVLSARVIKLRIRFRVGVGDGGEPLLERAIRSQGNFVEYVPLTLIVMFFFEVLTQYHGLVHIFGSALLIGRFFHAYGISQVDEILKLRQIGMMLNFLVLLALCFYILYYYIASSFIA